MEFENLQVEVPLDDDNDRSKEQVLDPKWEKVYHNKSKGFVVGLDLHSKEAVSRKERRAKRFGVKSTEDEDVETKDPFENIEVNRIEFPPVTDAAFAESRSESLLLYGVGKMSTKDVFHYFKNHGPDTMEWIDDDSCNVVWETEKMAKTAMNDMSRSYDELKELLGEGIEDDEINEEAAKIWRIARPYKKSDRLFIRTSTVEDKKLPGAAKRSLYYLVHGNGRQSAGKPGLISSSRKRKMQQANEFVKENLNSKKPDVQFMSLSDKNTASNLEVDDEVMDVDEELDFIPLKASKSIADKSSQGGMYADRIGTRNENQGGLPKFGREENLKIEVRNFKESSSKWTSGRRNQHKRDGSSSEDESDDEELDSDKAVVLPDFTEREKSQNEDKRNNSDSRDDLREEIGSHDLRAKIDNSTSTEKKMPDLRQKLRQKKNHLGLTKEQLNLCVEVTEVSDED